MHALREKYIETEKMRKLRGNQIIDDQKERRANLKER